MHKDGVGCENGKGVVGSMREICSVVFDREMEVFNFLFFFSFVFESYIGKLQG